MHSATKFLGGHADVMGGVVVVRDEKLAEDIYLMQNGEGNALAPFDCFLLLRGLKTLKIRVDAQQRNALAVAEFLAADPRVERVFYPGLKSDPGYARQQQQASGAGSVLCFTTRSSGGGARRGGARQNVSNLCELRQHALHNQPARVHVARQRSAGDCRLTPASA